MIGRRRWSCLLATLTVAIALLLAGGGCAGGAEKADDGRLHAPVQVRSEPWQYDGVAATTLTTPHYTIHTTIAPDEPILETLPQLLEAGYREYRIMAGDAVGAMSAEPQPLVCYVFGRRDQWNDFTRRRYVIQSRLLLQIVQGAYAIDDVFVAYDMGDARTISTTAHEGWHQFRARYFRTPLPPFLEEGIASQFEEVSDAGRVPTFDLGHNTRRLDGLRRVTRERFTFPLTELITLHPGQVLAYPQDRLQAYYSQVWSFVHFLRNFDRGKYREGFERLLVDAARGKVKGLAGTAQWGRDNIPRILVDYLGVPLDQLDREYLEYCRELIRRD